jgi:hypothetical protein
MSSKFDLVEAFELGRDAQASGIPLSGNPYRIRHDMAKEWERGWFEQEKVRSA